MASGAAYVVRLDGTTCLQLELSSGERITIEGDALQVADWYQTCVRVGISVRVQVNPDTPFISVDKDTL